MVSDQIRRKQGCIPEEDSLMLKISDLGRKGIVQSLERKLRQWSAVFAYAKIRYSHDASHEI